ncbi:hypothetical protein KIN20_009523 [Parelaphostrongylus tenuis]|uniref:Uncharacterized protein n=1 Tax=Parelaphostrongylus tenuis TaxID=148309 RepID=A0AAD5MP55_PARTN|nr:hypothetical protein KIN20_009523 [Parelaphostrongylus tenuis]
MKKLQKLTNWAAKFASSSIFVELTLTDYHLLKHLDNFLHKKRSHNNDVDLGEMKDTTSSRRGKNQ